MESNGTASSEVESSTQTSVAIQRPTAKSRRSASISDLSPEDQKVLVQELENAIIYFASNQLPVYLEGLGIVFPTRNIRRRVITMKDKFIVRRETVLSVGFEKARELVALHREQFSGVLDTKDLGYRVFEKASPFLSSPRTEAEIRKFLRGIIDEVRHDVTERGRSTIIKAVGDLYALHNRQGESMHDWFAGADIMLRPKFEVVLSSEQTPFLERPILASATEPFEALLGSPLNKLTVDVRAELLALGYDVDRNTILTPFSVSIFKETAKDGTSYIYVTESLRRIAHEKSSSRGNEFVVQCFIPNKRSSGRQERVDVEAPLDWPIRMLTLGWLLLHSSKTGGIRSGAGMHAGSRHLFGGEPSILSGIFALPCRRIGGEQLCSDGAFEFLQLIAIADDEANTASLHGPDVMASLLEHKKLDAITKPARTSLVSKSVLALPN